MRNKEKIFFETDRFKIRELELTDTGALYKLDSNPNVHKYLGDNPIKSKEDARKILEFIRKQYVENGIGRWAIINKENNEFIGWTGFKWITEETNGKKNYYNLGYRLIQENWGKGIATETAIGALKYGFENLKTDKIISIANCNNISSNKILQKIGMKLIEKFLHEGEQHNWYEINKTEFLKSILQK